MGELILANLYKITKGDHSVTAVDYYDPNQHEITIELDPSLGPVKIPSAISSVQ